MNTKDVINLIGAFIEKYHLTNKVELPDFKIRVLGRKVNIFQWIKDVRKSNCTFYYDKNDRKPFFSAIISKL